ncbi:hypothetical protein FS837_001839 [Tulasnella sp. UAMH 9824]|nr:hypothetical protein FS837_001839 [Tulasnella sp. UAMH 9824]
MALRDIAGRQASVSGASPQIPSRESNPSWSPPQSFQSRPSVAAQGASSGTPASKSFSRQKETGLIVYGGSPNGGDEEIGSRGRSGTTSTVHCPQYDIGPKDESIRSDLSTMGGGDEDAAEDRKAMLKLRHLSATNFLGSLPSDYLSQTYPGTTIASSSTSSSTLNNSIPFSSTSSEYQFSTSSSSASRPSVSASSDVYASSESSSSIAPSPLPVTPHSGGTGTMAHQQQMSMMSLVSPTPTQSSFLSSPGRTPQQQPFVDIRAGAGADAGMLSMSSMITSVQEELAAARKQMRQQALEMERMRSELEAVRKEKEEMKKMMCRSCGGRDVVSRSNSSESAGEPTEKRAAGVVNRPRAPTGSGGRFGSRMI